MKKHLFFLIIISVFTTAPMLGQDIRNLSAALHHAAEYAAPVSKITDRSPYIETISQQDNLTTVTIKTEKRRFFQHNKQLIFENGIYKGTREIHSVAKNGFVSITYNPAQFELYAVYSQTNDYKPHMPFMLSEVSSSATKYDVSDILITQYTTTNQQKTVFYFLLPTGHGQIPPNPRP